MVDQQLIAWQIRGEALKENKNRKERTNLLFSLQLNVMAKTKL